MKTDPGLLSYKIQDRSLYTGGAKENYTSISPSWCKTIDLKFLNNSLIPRAFLQQKYGSIVQKSNTAKYVEYIKNSVF